MKLKTLKDIDNANACDCNKCRYCCGRSNRYDQDDLRQEAIKYYKEIELCQKDINSSIKLDGSNIVCYPTGKVDKNEDECYLVKKFIKHFFNITEEVN